MARSEAEIQSALEAAAEADRTGQSYHLPPAAADESAPTDQPAPTEAHSVDTEPPATEPDSFTDVDLSNLPPEVRAAAELHRRRMQGDYTRKTQELAAQRAELEQRFGDVELAQQAVEFYDNFHTNPVFALDVANRLIPALGQMGYREQLTQTFQQAGLSPAQAQVAVEQHMAEANEYGYDPEDAEFWGFDDGPAHDPRVDELQARLDAMERMDQQRFQQEQQQRMVYALDGELRRQENLLLEERKYSESDLEKLYQIAPAHGYNLIQAADYYEGLREHFLGDYIGTKASNQTEPSHLPTGPGSTAFAEDRERGSVESARERALARLRAAGA